MITAGTGPQLLYLISTFHLLIPELIEYTISFYFTPLASSKRMHYRELTPCLHRLRHGQELTR